jgi:hypothetical protein
MGQNRRQILLLIAAVLVVSVCSARLLEGQRWSARKLEPYGLYTTEQILARSEPLFHALFPERSGLIMSAERQATQKSASEERLLWAVDCSDASGRHLAYLCWDAGTGDLVYSSRIREERSDKNGVERRTDSELLCFARDWLYTLGIAGNQEQWRFTGTCLSPQTNLHVYWRSEYHSADVVVDARSGDFVSASNGRQSMGRTCL